MSTWSPFARTITKVLPFPGSETETVTVRKLGYKALEDALNARQMQGLDYLRRIGPGGLLKELQEQGGEDALRKKGAADPFLQYDRDVLLERGIVSWTVSEKPTHEDIAELDVNAANVIAREIYELSRPRTEEERKNA